MRTRKIIHTLWLMCFCASVALLSFSQTYSQIVLAVAFPFFVIDTCIFQRFTLSEVEKKLYFIIALFLLLEIVSALSNSTPLKSLWLLREEGLFILLPVSLRAFREDSFRAPLLRTIMFSTLALAIYGMLQHYTGVNIFHPGLELYQSDDGLYITLGNFHNTLTFGNFMAVLAMFIISAGVSIRQGIYKYLFLLSGAFASLVTFFSYQRGSLLGLFAGAIAVVALCYRRRIASIVAIFGVTIVAGALLAPRIIDRLEESFQREFAADEMTDRDYSLRRTTIWKTSLAIIADNPVFGVGSGNFEEAYHRYADSSVVLFFSHAHNDVLNVTACSGIPALLVYAWLWLHVLLELVRRRRRKDLDPAIRMAISATLVASVTFLAVSLTEVAFTKEVVRSALMIFWGYGLWGLERAEAERSKQLSASSSPDSAGVHFR